MEIETKIESSESYNDSKLDCLKLKRVFSENHESNINQMCQNTCSEKYRHLFATVGANQVNIYDNKGMENNLNLCFNFYLEQSEFSMGGEVCCCTWLKGDDDALLAIGTTKGEIHILSLRNTQVITILIPQVREEIVSLYKCDTHDNLLVALSRQGNATIWDYQRKSMVYELCGKSIRNLVVMTKDDVPCFLFIGVKSSYQILLPSTEFLVTLDIEAIPVDFSFIKSSDIYWLEWNSKYNRLVILSDSYHLYIVDYNNQDARVEIIIPSSINRARNLVGFTITQDQEHILVGGSDKYCIVNMKGKIINTIPCLLVKRKDFISAFIDNDFDYLVSCFGITMFRYNYINPKTKYVTRIRHAYPVEDLLLFYENYDATPKVVLEPKD
ncbi:hypothetical protein WA158_005478 [Blastocystis sp. Blastoise]